MIYIICSYDFFLFIKLNFNKIREKNKMKLKGKSNL
jgi:hypothetical protein